jgi:hypothetical protein
LRRNYAKATFQNHVADSGRQEYKVFHLRASHRRKKNCILKLKRPDGQVIDNAEEMGDFVTDFYKALYQ